MSKCGQWRVAGLVVLTFALSACTEQPEPAPAPRATAAPRHTATPSPAVTRPGPSTAAAMATSATVRPAAVRSVRVVPDSIDPYACPPVPPQRPEVFVELDDGDHRRADLTVTLQYSAGERYSGTAPMRYDAAGRVFTYRLPPVSRDNLPWPPPSIMNVGLSVGVTWDMPPWELAPPAPTMALIRIQPPCAGSLQNGPAVAPTGCCAPPGA